ncbi:MAG: Mpv17/PMP22 family protein [Nanoarchaeota archaeon]
MAETPLEQTANVAPSEEKKEEKQEEKKQKSVGTLESVVKESWHAFTSGAKLAGAALMPYAVIKAVPASTLDTLTWTGAVAAADATTNFRKGKRHAAREILNSSAVASATALPVHYLYKAINNIPLDSALGYFQRAAAFGGLAYPAFIGMYQTVDYLVRNLKFKGLGKYLKENYWPVLKKAWKYVFPLGLANIFFAPAYLQVAIGSAISYALALFGAPKKGELKESEKRDKTPYLVAASSAAYKLGRSLFYAPLKAVEAIGGAVKDLYKKGPAKASAPAAQHA